MNIRPLLCLMLATLAGCAHQPPPRFGDEGGRGTRVTNPRIAPWAFFRGDQTLLVGAAVSEGDVVETQCAYDACDSGFRHLSIWQIASERPTPSVTSRQTTTHPDREQRIKLAPDARYLVIAWSRTPLESMPTLDLTEGTRKGPHTQTTIIDDRGAVLGVVQWGPVDKVR